MTSDMFAPEIQSYIHWLGNMEHHGVGSQFLFDEKSHVHLDDLFKTLQSLDPVNDNGVYELWLRANRGRLEDFGDFEEYRDAGEVESFAEFEQFWVSEFPAETVDNRLFKKLEHPYPFPASFRKGIPAYLPPVKVEST